MYISRKNPIPIHITPFFKCVNLSISWKTRKAMKNFDNIQKTDPLFISFVPKVATAELLQKKKHKRWHTRRTHCARSVVNVVTILIICRRNLPAPTSAACWRANRGHFRFSFSFS